MLYGLSLLMDRPEVWLVVLCMAGIPAVYWLLGGSFPRSAGVVETDPEAPAPGRRERALLLIATGLSLLLAGVFVALTIGIPWSIPLFAAGVWLVLWQNQANRPYLHASPILRSASDLSHLFLNTALLGGILVIANLAAFRYGGQGIDLTRERTFSLSSLTLNQLESLKRPVTFHVVYGGGTRSARQLDRVVQILDLYRAANPSLIKVDSLNPYTELARGEELTRRAPDLALLQGGGILIEYGEGTSSEFAVVTGQEMFEPVPGDTSADSDRFRSSFKGEDAITAVLIRLQEGRKSKVAFLTGHGEPSSSDLNRSGPGIGLWRARLASVGCEPIELNLLSEAIPDDLALLMIVGPRTPLKPEELSKIRAYSDRGGPLLVLIGNSEPTGLEDFLKGFNLELQRGLVIDPGLNFNRNVQLVFALLRGGQNHPITASLPLDRAILLPNAAPIRILGLGPSAPGKPASAPVNPNPVPVVVLRTGPRSWAETDMGNPRPRFDEGADVPGPVTVGVAVQERVGSGTQAREAGAEPKPRLVLFSSRALGDNVVQGIEPTNLDLLMNATSWLRGRSNVVGIPANTHMALTLTADPLLRSRLVLVPSVLMVLATITTGVLVYMARRE
jgi:hypothetical protein